LRLATVLVRLVLSVLLPALALGIAAILLVMNNTKVEAQERLVDTAEALALVVDRELKGYLTALTALAASPALHGEAPALDLPGFHAHAKRAADHLDSGASLIRRDGTHLPDSSDDGDPTRGEKSPPTASQAMIDRVFATGRPAIGDVVRSPASGRPMVGAAVPVRDAGGQVVLALVRGFDVERLRTVLRQQSLPPNSFAGIVDSNNVVVARSDEWHSEIVGRSADAEDSSRLTEADSGLSQAAGLDGLERIYAFHRASTTAGWAVVIGRSAADVEFIWHWPLAIFGSGATLVLVLSVWLAWLTGRRILVPLQQLGRHASAIAMSPNAILTDGDSARLLPPAPVMELEKLRLGFAAAEAALRLRVEAEHVSAEALTESEARLKAITDAMPQMLWSARPDGYRDYFNQRWYDLTGTAPQSADEVTVNDAWIRAFHPDDQERARARWRHSVETGETYEIECRLRMADGCYRWMLGRARPVRDPDNGAISRWFGTCTDIEETVAARQALAQSREDLEHLVKERTDALQEAQANLAQTQRMDALGQLAGGIAHDFNNILQAVHGGAALIERQPSDPTGVRRLARLVIEAAERGSAITQRLLAFSRRGELRAEPVDAVSLLVGIKEILTHTLGAGVVVRLELKPALPLLLADKGQLETVLINLATNARDAMSGMGTLTLAAAVERLTQDAGPRDPVALKAGTYLRLWVTDTGTGMDSATLVRVTEPFFTTKPTGKGTGLGLSMARGFAEQSGGGLHIRSALGQGTTVALWLPVAGAAAIAEKAPFIQGSRLPGDTKVRLLLVDDEPLVRLVLAEELQAEGYSVLTAESADAALAQLDAGAAVDVMVSDLSMPGMDGVTLIREVHKRRPRLPAILLTGYATNAMEIAVGGAVSGAFTLLRKPIDGKVLGERAAVLLEGMLSRQ
jgi:PAS domain S-box-containing protein